MISEVTILWIVREILGFLANVNPWKTKTISEQLIENEGKRITKE